MTITESDIKRIDEKLDRLLEALGLSENSHPRRSAKQLDDVAKKSVLDFQKKVEHKKGHGGEKSRGK